MKRTRWYSECLSHGEVDATIVEAAWRVRRTGHGSDVEAPFRERALAQLHRRHAKLVREVAMVEATIASMQRGLN